MFVYLLFLVTLWVYEVSLRSNANAYVSTNFCGLTECMKYVIVRMFVSLLLLVVLTVYEVCYNPYVCIPFLHTFHQTTKNNTDTNINAVTNFIHPQDTTHRQHNEQLNKFVNQLHAKNGKQ